MEIHMQIALGPDFQVHHGMAAEALQHMVQKADPGIDVALAGAVQIERNRDFGLAGLPFNGSCAHLSPLAFRGL